MLDDQLDAITMGAYLLPFLSEALINWLRTGYNAIRGGRGLISRRENINDLRGLEFTEDDQFDKVERKDYLLIPSVSQESFLIGSALLEKLLKILVFKRHLPMSNLEISLSFSFAKFHRANVFSLNCDTVAK